MSCNRLIAIAAGLLCLVATAGAAGGPETATGESLYLACANCHGERGEGSLPMDAPQVAGLADWYLEEQLRKYRDGRWGDHPDDVYGRQMVLFAKALPDEASIEAVSAYLSDLPATPRPSTIEGDPARGATLYQSCRACHGDAAEGNERLKAPGLGPLDDWYMVRQMQNYRDGRRGYADNDPLGQQMRAAANLLKDDQDIRDLVAYISGISGVGPP